ncbi:MAG: phosphatidylglycerophosphatase A [Thermodesulfobacteriota bacterium]|nr:MAG: phosphatidylglycerophosphatase A [Thermodesulfobacteriota bacterium]
MARNRTADAVITFLATGAYVGFSPVMPGTIGTLWGILIAYLTRGAGPYIQAALIIVVFIASVYVSSRAVKIFRSPDPGSVVCDEVAGVLVAFFLIPFTAFNAILVFILFRFFDILKPPPISTIEKGFKGGLGVVLDDIAAGVLANIGVRIILGLLTGI